MNILKETGSCFPVSFESYLAINIFYNSKIKNNENENHNYCSCSDVSVYSLSKE